MDLSKNIFNEFYLNYLSSLNKLEKDKFYKNFNHEFNSGKTTVYQNLRKETKIFDEEWINTVESYFPSLNKIILNPKSGLKYEEEVVLVEKAKKIDSNSVKFLASHTQYIKEVKNDGSIIPSKIQTTFSEIDYGTYENRFIKTLIERLFIFVRRRYEIIRENVESFEKKRVIINSSFPFNNINVDYKLDLTIKEDLEDKSINEYNKNLLRRVEELNFYVTSIYQSQFMRDLANVNSINPPIIKTSVILNNVDYGNAYLLWLFIERYNTLAFNQEVLDKTLELNNEALEQIKNSILYSFLTIYYNQENQRLEYDKKAFTKNEFKAIKQEYTNPDDFILTNDEIEVESNAINEFYYSKFEEIFENKVKEIKESNTKYEIPLRSALMEIQNITNTLYEHKFLNKEEEKDIFKRLSNEVDPLKALDLINERLELAKIIRTTKEVDYYKSIRLERELLKSFNIINDKLIEASKQNIILTAKKTKDESLLREEKLNAEALNDYLNERRDIIIKNKKEQTLDLANKNNEIKKLIETLRQNELEAKNIYEAKLNKELDLKIKKFTSHYNLELKKLVDQYSNREKQLETKHRFMIGNLISEHEEKIKSDKALVLDKITRLENKFKTNLDNKLFSQKIKLEEEAIKKILEREKKLSELRQELLKI